MRNYPVITDRKIRLALVGCGRISANHFGAMEQHADRVEIVDVCDVDPIALDKAVKRTAAKGHSSLTEMLKTSTADMVVLATPSGLHPQQSVEIAESGRHVMTEKTDGDTVARWLAHGQGMRRSRSEDVRRQAEPPQCHAAAAQACCRAEALWSHLHGQYQRLLDPTTGILRQRKVARHMGVRRRRLHEPGKPLRRPARLVDRSHREHPGLYSHAGAGYPGRG
jgi:hypothetical protein